MVLRCFWKGNLQAPGDSAIVRLRKPQLPEGYAP
jgi:hypothetical protein